MRTRGVTTAQEWATGKPGLKFLMRAAEDERRVTDLVSLPMVRYVPALVRECAPHFQGGPMELPDTAAQACGTCRNRLKRGGVKLIVAHDGDTVSLAGGPAGPDRDRNIRHGGPGAPDAERRGGPPARRRRDRACRCKAIALAACEPICRQSSAICACDTPGRPVRAILGPFRPSQARAVALTG